MLARMNGTRAERLVADRALLLEALDTIAHFAMPLTKQGEDRIWRPAKKIVDLAEWAIAASAIEARRAETAKTGSTEGESAVPKGDAR